MSLFTQDNLKELLDNPDNDYLSKSPEDKYDMFKDKDPFPCIHSALLNSEDIIKYILATGMMYPFIPENLQGATYTCTFSGTYLRFDSEGQADTKTLSDGEPLFIEPNSITYLEINERFMVPSYMVLRFNLKVPHVYKGLLLGTGPIVDPGFVGKLYIPLHNLTMNKYCIKKGAGLISVEFTKLNIKKEWADLNSYRETLISKWNFSYLPKDIQKKIKPDRGIFEYLKKSLQEDELFYKKPENDLSVGSSLANYVKQLKEIKENIELNIQSINNSISNFEMQSKEMNDKTNSSLKETEKLKNKSNKGMFLSIIISTIISVVGVYIAVVSLVNQASQAFDAIQKERVEYRDKLNIYQEKVNNLENSVTELIIEDKKEHLDLLKEEYDLFINKNDPKAINIYNQITELEEEVSELQEKLN